MDTPVRRPLISMEDFIRDFVDVSASSDNDGAVGPDRVTYCCKEKCFPLSSLKDGCTVCKSKTYCHCECRTFMKYFCKPANGMGGKETTPEDLVNNDGPTTAVKQDGSTEEGRVGDVKKPNITSDEDHSPSDPVLAQEDVAKSTDGCVSHPIDGTSGCSGSDITNCSVRGREVMKELHLFIPTESDEAVDVDETIYCCEEECFPVPTLLVDGVACEGCMSCSYCRCRCRSYMRYLCKPADVVDQKETTGEDSLNDDEPATAAGQAEEGRVDDNEPDTPSEHVKKSNINSDKNHSPPSVVLARGDEPKSTDECVSHSDDDTQECREMYS